MRLEKPIGSWLLFWPGAWGIAMAAHPELPSWKLLGLFGIGAIVMRGAGCIINDIWDCKVDRMVERTRTRPLAAGKLTKLQAVTWLGVQLSAGLAILLQLNKQTVVLGVISLVPVTLYPAMKRITYWPQLVLGLTFNWGALVGWTAQTGTLDLATATFLYVGGVCWTLVYDTIYALQDVKDDVQIGVKSTAILFGDRVKSWLSAFAGISVVAFAMAGSSHGMGVPYYLGVGGAAIHYAWQIATLDRHSLTDCLAKFKSNRYLGGMIFAGIVLDTLHCQAVAEAIQPLAVQAAL